MDTNIPKTELIAGSKTPDQGVKDAMMKALQEAVSKAGTTMSEQSRNAILGLIDDDSTSQSGMLMSVPCEISALC